MGLILRATLLLASSVAAAGQGGPQAPPDLSALCARFSGFDQDGDGTAEVEALAPLGARGADGPLVLVLVEERLLAPLEGAPELAPRLERWLEDLAREGWRAALVATRLEASERHQDGRTLLALRELLRAAHADETLGPLGGVLLVGRFPDAFLVRTCNWRKRGAITLRGGQPDEARLDGPYLRRVPEDVAHRADVVLGDLDGRWEDVYHQPRTRLETLHAVFPDGVPPRGGPCADLARGAVEYEDFFLVSDGRAEVAERLDGEGAVVGYTVTLADELADLECGAADRARPNPLPVPEVGVGRIDALGVALAPRADVTGVDGEGLLDTEGRPRAVRFADAEGVPHWSAPWAGDARLERRLLAEYLDRNHRYRTGADAPAWRPASIACDLGSGFDVVRSAAADWSVDWDARERAALDVHGRPTLVQLVEWLREPAVLRTLRAHSDPWGSVFARPDVAALEAAVGGPSWSWTRQGDALVPSLSAACGGGKLDFFLLRTLWESGSLPDAGALWIHTGCHGISPPGAASRPYHHPGYGARQGAEALLFYAGGLALVGRAKVFYDEPRGFAAVLAEGGTFGAAWRRYFEVEAEAAAWGAVGGDIGRKRATFWSVLGDWTLRLRRPGG